MLDPQLLKLEDKKYTAHSKDRATNTDKLIKELKPTGKIEIAKPIEIAGAELITIRGKPFVYNDFTPEQIDGLKVKGDKGEQGTQGIQGIEGKVGKQGLRGLKGDKGLTGKNGENGIDGVNGIDGKDGKSPTPEEVINKLQSLKDAWLEVNNIKGLDKILQDVGNNFLNQAKGMVSKSLRGMYDVDVMNIADQQSLIWSAIRQKFVPGSATSTGGGFTKLLSTETPDGTNTVFTYSQKPLYIISGGAWYEENNGWTWNSGTSQATLSVPPPAQSLKLLAFV